MNLDLTKIIPSATQPQKCIKTRNGREVYIYWVGKKEIHGATKAYGEERCVHDWYCSGNSMTNESKNLIIFEPEEIVYMNWYKECLSFKSKEECKANFILNYHSLAILKITLKNQIPIKIEIEEP